MTCRTLLLAHTRMAQPLAWSGGSLCVAYAHASMPRVPRGPRRPPRHAWHRLVRPNLAAPAAASLSAIMAGPSVAAGAVEKAAGCSYYMLSAKVNVCVTSTARSDHDDAVNDFAKPSPCLSPTWDRDEVEIRSSAETQI